MIKRLLNLPRKHSFFIFGPRQTGKSTLIQSTFPANNTLTYDLLKSEEYLRLSADPSLFRQEVLSRGKKNIYVVVDEIQRVPKLLNEIHYVLENDPSCIFCLSGSSARKLKRMQANLLAGRAWTFHLFPLTHCELQDQFVLDRAINLGTLPSVYLSTDEEARRTLRAYTETYLKEEVQQEALVRNLGSFLRFLSLAADENGNIINYSNIARETGTSYQTIKEYFQILEDTLIGFTLPAYSKKTRRRLMKHPKFYFFDTGVHRALTKKISLYLEPRTSEYGRAFEHYMIAEIIRLSSYKETDYKFSFYHSSAHAEVDLIIETPKGKTYAIEIKASTQPDVGSLKGLGSFLEICPKAELICLSLAPHKRQAGPIWILPWKEAFKIIRLD